MPELRKPNHDARGNSLSGQPVNYDANTGDTILLDDEKMVVTETTPNSIIALRQSRNEEGYYSYETLRRRDAVFA